MGKKGKKQRHQSRTFSFRDSDGEPELATVKSASQCDESSESDLEDDSEGKTEEHTETTAKTPSIFSLYQQSVQSPKGDITYLLKFFLMYVGGRLPLHLQEDFCGTALLSAEWLRSDSRRTAVGLDLDLESLNWCFENNMNIPGSDGYSRITLFHGNVLQPMDAKPVNIIPRSPLPSRDIICAFNYSCCCLHKRADLMQYLKHVHSAISTKGGIFVMDLYGGTSSERDLKLKREFPDFTYVWEQDEFDIVQRRTRIRLHFQLRKEKKKLRNAFSYSWRLWSLPEIKDCLEEVGFESVHFWLREMPDSELNRSTQGFGLGKEVKYEEVSVFNQVDSWNAYVVAVANKELRD